MGGIQDQVRKRGRWEVGLPGGGGGGGLRGGGGGKVGSDTINYLDFSVFSLLSQ